MPQTTTITCRYCGAGRDVPAYYAGRYSTCGAPECTAQRVADRALAAATARSGKPQSEESNRNRSAALKGRIKSPAHIAAVVAARKANGSWFRVPDIGQRISAGKKGKPVDVAGPKNGMWRGGVSQLAKGGRATLEYRAWRTAVLDRDEHRCTRCGTDKNVIAHHVEGWREAPHLRAEVVNGVALCRSCHSTAHDFTKHFRRD